LVVIAISNQKGGVGKTTIAYNLAWILSRRRNTRVLAIDNDPQGNLTSSFLKVPVLSENHVLRSYENETAVPFRVDSNLHLLGADITLAPIAERDFRVIFRLKEYLEKLQKAPGNDSYDYVLVDCLPSFGHLHLAALHAADFVLIPVKPAPFAFAGMKDLLGTIEKAKKYINPGIRILGIVVNQVDGRGLVMEREMEELLRETHGELVFKTKISKLVKIEESPAFQKPITRYEAKGAASREFEALSKEIIQRIKKATRDSK
jgi:chromosome partitioning protein